MPVFTPQRSLMNLQKSIDIISFLFKGMSTERAKQLAPGIVGWSALEVMGHLVDLESVFTARIRRVLVEDNPAFTPIDPDQLAIDNAYAQQDIQKQVAKFIQLRKELIALLNTLTEEQWSRGGIHPSYGPMTILDIATNTPLHDHNHLGQIAEALG